MAVQIQLRRGTASQWTTADPVLAEGEMGLEIDTGKFKVGNGDDAWSALTYSSGPAGATGPQGPQGETGAALTLQGTYATTAALFAAHPTGSAGEGWIVEADGDLYVWDVDANEWVSVGQIVGPPGPANTLTIGTVATLAAGSAATATITGTPPNQVLNLGIPQGVEGTLSAAGLAAAGSAISAAGSASASAGSASTSASASAASAGSASASAGAASASAGSASASASAASASAGSASASAGSAASSAGSAAASAAEALTYLGGINVFRENAQLVENNYTITANRSAVSAGPIRIASGVTVEVPIGSVWVVL